MSTAPPQPRRRPRWPAIVVLAVLLAVPATRHLLILAAQTAIGVAAGVLITALIFGGAGRRR